MSSPFYDDKLNHYDVDLKKANKLLDEAGYKKQADGFRFKLTIDYQPINPDLNQNVAEYLRPQLAKAGIKVEVRKSPDMATWMQRVANFDYDMTVDNVFNWGDPVIGVARSYLSTNVRKGVVWANMSGYKNQKVDGLLAQAAVSNDAQKRKDLYFQFQKIVNDELPVAWLFAYFPNTVYSKKLLNLPEGIWGAMAPLNDVAWKK
jgi:peptide/nickel transport system substrate-binding protein